MELGYNLFVSAFTAICLSFLVARLVSLALFSGEDRAGNELSTGVDNGGGGVVGKGKSEKRLRVEGSKSKKKRVKKISSETVLVDDCKKRNVGFPVSNEGVISQIGAIEDQDQDVPVFKEGVVRWNEEGEIEEEWEGIEMNELERDFAKAMSFVQSVEKQGWLNKLGNDVIMQLYGLQKVAMEGSCYDDPQPVALKLSARPMWNAWPKTGSMNPEDAMEKYITLLSDKVPGWMDGHSSDEE